MATDLLRRLVIALIFTPLVALVVQYLAQWLAGLRPRYASALASVASSCVLGAAVAFTVAKVCAPPNSLSLAAAISHDSYPTKEFVGDIVVICVGFAISSLCHRLIIRGRNGERLTSSKAIQLTCAQTVMVFLVRLAFRIAL